MMNNSTNRKFQILLALSLTVLLQACGSKVDCNNSKNKDNALEIIQSNLSNAVWYNQLGASLKGTPELSSIKTVSKNDELKQSQCNGKYSFTYNEKLRTIDVNYEIAYLQDKGESEVKVFVNEVIGGFIGLVGSEPPIRNGIEKKMDSKTGNLLSKTEWKNGVQDGLAEIYNPVTKKLISQINFVKGNKDGLQKEWTEDGSMQLVDLMWIAGKATGYQKFLNTDNGKLLVDLTWKDGKESGFITTGYLNFKHEEHFMKDGLLHGIYKEYDVDNIYDSNHNASSLKVYLATTANYKDGKLDGQQKTFDVNGKTTSEKNYKEGIEVAENTATVNGNASDTTTKGASEPEKNAPDTDKSITTRAGRLTVTGDSNDLKLLLNGKAISKSDGYALDIIKKYTIENNDVVLLMETTGGTACPAKYFFATITTPNGNAQISPQVGNCSDLASPVQQAAKIILTMPKMSGKGQDKYVYENGVISENGKIVK